MAEKTGVHARVQESKPKCSNFCKQKSGYNSSGSSADRILQLQRTAGNQAVQRLIKSRALQAKLTIGQPGDIYEQEADRVAEQVLATPTHHVVSNTSTRIQCFPEQSTGQMGATPASVNQALSSPGRSLEPALRQDMEQRFGYNFSEVRVHTGEIAERSAQEVSANAYTMGNKIVFGAGRFAPETQTGVRLLAHELVHVVQQSGADSMRAGQSDNKRGLPPLASFIQQGQSVPSPIGASIGQVSNRLIQRDQGPKKPEKGIEKAAEKTESKALEESKSTALSELKEIELNWKELRDPAAGFSDVTDWLVKGDMVIGLLRTHTELALDAIDKGDFALSKFMTSIVESDMVMYRFIAWHVAVYVNLLSLEPDLKDLIRAFDADDRAFTGRAKAEEIVRLLIQLAGRYRKQAPKWLELVKTLPAEVERTSGHKISLTVTIAAHQDKSVRDLFANETEKFIQDQAALETLVGATNQFLDTAFEEGLVQAAEAIVEFYSVRGGKRGGPKTSRKKKEKKKEKKKKKYQCTAKCQQQCPGGVEGTVPGISNKNCSEATQRAKSAIRKGCYPRHCNCKDTDGFIGTGTQCENHTR